MNEDIESLNSRVTAAIMQAESLRFGTPEARAAFAEVADIEEELTRVTSPGSVEGAIARCGAVRAAMDAGKIRRARRLAVRFLAEKLDEKVRWRLEGLALEAERVIALKVNRSIVGATAMLSGVLLLAPGLRGIGAEVIFAWSAAWCVVDFWQEVSRRRRNAK